MALFVAASAGLVAFSWRCLRDPRSHGFYRFFGFEAVVAVIVLNLPVWFRDPFCVRQWVSWALGAASIGLVIEGFRLLRIVGNPQQAAALSTNMAFENTTVLVKVGAYRFIRHPMYASLLALAWAAGLKDVSATSLGLAAAATGLFLVTAIIEERENLARFGAPYAAYMRETRRFVPFVF